MDAGVLEKWKVHVSSACTWVDQRRRAARLLPTCMYGVPSAVGHGVKRKVPARCRILAATLPLPEGQGWDRPVGLCRCCFTNVIRSAAKYRLRKAKYQQDQALHAV